MSSARIPLPAAYLQGIQAITYAAAWSSPVFPHNRLPQLNTDIWEPTATSFVPRELCI